MFHNTQWKEKFGEQNPSTHCRSCWKYLAPDPSTSDRGKQSKDSLHYPLINKEFMTSFGLTHVTLNHILENWGSVVNNNDEYSQDQVFRMSCARSLVRTFATQTKLIQNCPPGTAVRLFSSGSPLAGCSRLALLEQKIKVANPESHWSWQCTSWFKSISTTSGSIRSKGHVKIIFLPVKSPLISLLLLQTGTAFAQTARTAFLTCW